VRCHTDGMRVPSLDDPDPLAAAAGARRVPRALVALPIDVEPANGELIQLWLAAEGWDVQFGLRPNQGVAVILIEMAFPRHGDRQRVQAVSEAWPGVPVIVLSPTFFPDVPGQGSVAQQLGATAVLSTPLQRDRLVAVVRALLGPPA
jgi:hypothetical protein